MRKVSWYLAAASLVLPALLLLQSLPRGPATVHGHFGDLGAALAWLAAVAMCFVLSTLAALLNGWALRRSGPASDRRLAEWLLVASPVLLMLLALLFYPVWRVF